MGIFIYFFRLLPQRFSRFVAFAVLAFLPFWCGGSHACAQLYYNSGNNTTGFVTQYDYGGTFTSNGAALDVHEGGIWDDLPVTVTGNFQISYKVLNETGDGDSHLLLLNPGTEGGIGVTDSPQNTDTPYLTIVSGTNFTNYQQYFFPTAAETLASVPSSAFPNFTWTSIVVTRTGNILTDDVDGQIIQYNVAGYLGDEVQIGLGGYATTKLGGTGDLYYDDIVVTPEPSAWMNAVIALLSFGVLRRAWAIGASRRQT